MAKKAKESLNTTEGDSDDQLALNVRDAKGNGSASATSQGNKRKSRKKADRKTKEKSNGNAEPKTVDPRNTLNDLTSTEWFPETVSVWNQRGLGAKHPDAQIERQHPAPFSFTDVSRLIKFFTTLPFIALAGR